VVSKETNKEPGKLPNCFSANNFTCEEPTSPCRAGDGLTDSSSFPLAKRPAQQTWDLSDLKLSSQCCAGGGAERVLPPITPSSSAMPSLHF